MPSNPYIKKKIGLSYLIWLQNSNKYILLEEPAWYVFSKTVKRYKVVTVAEHCTRRYNLTAEEGLSFVKDIRAKIVQMNLPDNEPVIDIPYPDQLKAHRFKPYSLHRYRFGENLIDFSFETPYFESYLHPMICHLETTDKKEKVAVFELFEFHDRIVFRLDGKIRGVWTYEETHLVKGLIFTNLINVMFDKTDDFWLMTVHASAITNGQKTILIPASPGSGKTTMAAMLQNHGYQIVSDDFVPIDRHSFHAWPFPIALSVKQGSVNLLSAIYSDLEQRPLNYLSAEKSVRYIWPDHTHEFVNRAFPIKEFVFIKYNPLVDFEWKKIDQVQAIKLLLDQSWISPSEGNAEIFLHQLTQWSFYQLSYSNNKKALEAITNLFDND